MQVVLKITDLPSGSSIGPTFNVIPNVGTVFPTQVTLIDLLSPTGAIVTVDDNVENITLQSTGGQCSSSKKVTIEGLCGKPLRCCVIEDTTSTTTSSGNPTSTTTISSRRVIQSNVNQIEFFDPCVIPGTPWIKSFTLTGQNLFPNSNIIIQSPTIVFGISESVTGPWSTSITFNSSSGGFINPNPKVIYVKFDPPVPLGYTGTIGIAGAGAPQVNIDVTGNITGSCFTATTTNGTIFIPFDFVYRTYCSGVNFRVDIARTVGGVPPYSASPFVFSTEAGALANTDWTLLGPEGSFAYAPGGLVPGTPLPDGTYWMVFKDSVGTLKTHSVVNTCNAGSLVTTTTTARVFDDQCKCYEVTNISGSTIELTVDYPNLLCAQDYLPPGPIANGGSDIIQITGIQALLLQATGDWTVAPATCIGCEQWQNVTNAPLSINYKDCNGVLKVAQIVAPGGRICYGVGNSTEPGPGWVNTFFECG
jgi:hypothetical protein